MDLKKYVFSVVKKLIKQKFNENSNINDIGIDSLDLVEVILEVEKKFNITITDKELMQIQTIKDIIVLLKKKVK